jgi:anti-sigma regulatory factor (Ser/Thr protein kinase)
METSFRERQIVLERALTELDRLSAFARAIGHDEGLPADRIFALELCLEEAAANIIMHGGAGDHAGKQITVTFMRGAPVLTVRLEDDGSPFDPTIVPPPAAPASLEEAQVGGMGVHLIRNLATGMLYERVDGRNRLTLTFGPQAVART